MKLSILEGNYNFTEEKLKLDKRIDSMMKMVILHLFPISKPGSYISVTHHFPSSLHKLHMVE